jgi:hypothetical protein
MNEAQKDIDELMTLLREEFQREFTAGEAAEIAERLMAFVEAVR